MTKTRLPTKNDYQNAVDELKKLNEELFYDDFKMKIKALESNLEQLAYSNSYDFKKEAENVVNRAGSLFRQIESQQEELRDLLDNNQKEISQKNQDFLEHERTQLLFVYEEMHKNMNLATEQTTRLQETIESNNRHLIKHALATIESVSINLKEFVQKLSLSNERNREFLEENKTYVTLTTGLLNETEKKLLHNTTTLQQMGLRWEQLIKLSEKNYQKHEESLKKIFEDREYILVKKITELQNDWTIKQFEQGEAYKLDILKWQEKFESLLKTQSNQSEDMLKSILGNMANKEELARIEKKSLLKTNILLSIVFLEAVLIGVQIFT